MKLSNDYNQRLRFQKIFDWVRDYFKTIYFK